MNFVTIGFFVSVACFFLLNALFSYEERRRVRFLEGLRTYIDRLVYRFEGTLSRMISSFGGVFFRQLFQYIFHTTLRLILSFLRRCDRKLQDMMRTNRTIAQNMNRENSTRNKLDEIALHKVTSALSEKEKQEHKDKILSGG